MVGSDQLDSWLRLSQKLSEDERSIMQDEPCDVIKNLELLPLRGTVPFERAVLSAPEALGESVTEPSTSFLFVRITSWSRSRKARQRVPKALSQNGVAYWWLGLRLSSKT
jgi:hypothetical protein